MPADVQTQVNQLRRFVNAGQFDRAYFYIQVQISGDSRWDQRVATWFSMASNINRRGLSTNSKIEGSLVREFVWRMNNLASIRQNGRPVTTAENQSISNDLARTVIEDYISAIQGNRTLSPDRLRVRDVGAAVAGLGISDGAWAGGVLGIAYGFDMFGFRGSPGVFKDPSQVTAWIANAKQVLAGLLADTGNIDVAASSLGQGGLDLMRAFGYLAHHLNEIPAEVRQAVADFVVDVGDMMRNDSGNAGLDGLLQGQMFDWMTGLDGSTTSADLLRRPSTFDGLSGNTELTSRQVAGLPEFVALRSDGIFTDTRSGRRVEVDFSYNDDGSLKTEIRDGRPVPVVNSVIYVGAGSTVVKTIQNGDVVSTDILINNNLFPIDYSDVFGILGQQLGYVIDGGVAGIVASAALQTLGNNLGDALDDLIGRESVGQSLEDAFSAFPQEIVDNLKSAGVGAISSYLVAELINTLGIDGFVGHVAETASSAVLGQVALNLTNLGLKFVEGGVEKITTPFSHINPVMLGTAVGSFLGNSLAREIHSWDTIGGQLGAAAGSAIVLALDVEFFKAAALTGNPVVIGAAVVIAALDALLGNLVGGLIGSIFGGTPRSGADVTWDDASGRFAVTNVWSKKGGSKDAARSVASAVSTTINSVLDNVGGTLLDARLVSAGNYGMRKDAFVYRPGSTQIGGAATQKFKGSGAPARLIGYGVYNTLADPNFRIAGGDVYTKRALYNTIQDNSIDDLNFDGSLLAGNLGAAQRYEAYLANLGSITELLDQESGNLFAIESLLTLARAQELGLTRRAASDWFGGFSFAMREAQTSAINVVFEFGYYPPAGQISRSIKFGDYFRGDDIDVAGQVAIEAGEASDIIDLRPGKIIDQRGFVVNSHLNNDIAGSGSDFTALATTLTFAASALRTTVQVGVANDSIAEATEAFLGSLSNAPGMQVIGGAAKATVLDGSVALPTLVVGNSYAWEGDGYAVFRVSLSKAATGAITVSLALSADKASAGGIDFGSPSSSNIQVSADGATWTNATSATFAAGVTQLFVRTAVTADNAANPDYVAPVMANGAVVSPGNGEPQYLNVEGNEIFSLQATVTAGTSMLSNGAQTVSGTGTIVDGVGTEPLVWIDNVVVDEASGKAVFTVSRSRTMSSSTTVDFATSDRRVLDIPVAATVDGGAGNDTIYASDLGDNVFGGAGDDILYGGRLDDWLLGGDGNDTLDAGSTAAGSLGGDGNYLDGGAGNDTLRGREGSDWLEGGDGTDTLDGGAGDDVLVGGAGEGDSLKGGTGGDQYVVRRGDGSDVIDEASSQSALTTGSTDFIAKRMSDIAAGLVQKSWAGTAAGVQASVAEGGEDAIVFGNDIAIGDIRLQRSGTSSAPGGDLIITVMETVNGAEQPTSTRLTVKDWFLNPFKRIEWLKFADGNEVRIGDITSFIVGGSGNDVLIGTAGDDFVYGGAGDDQLYLLTGNDVGNGGTGDDMVAGDAGRDLLIGGLGNDQLLGGSGADAISGDDGADSLYGGADKDILSGGKGDGDVVVGGAGDDTFKYTRGDGKDLFFDEYANSWSVVWTSAGGWNTAAGYAYDPRTGVVTGPNGAVLRSNNGTVPDPIYKWNGLYDFDSVTGTLKVFVSPADQTITANSGTDTIEFAPGINLQDIILRRPGGTNDLVLAVSREDEDLADTTLVSDSVTIKDWYTAPGSIEKLAFYQTGVLSIAAGTMNLIAGTDAADGSNGAPLVGTAGKDWITGAAGDDVIAGGADNDILAGNSGFDTLRGEAGDDVLYGGTGDDVLDGGSGKDVLVGGAGLDTASYASASGAVRVQLSGPNTNAGDAAGDEYYSIENVLGSSGSDVIGGDGGQNELTGAYGNDVLSGNTGDDTYVWNVGDGADEINEGAFVVEEAVTTAGVLAAGYSVASWAATGATDAASGKRYWRLQIKGPDGAIVYDWANFLYAAGTTPSAPTPAAYDLRGWDAAKFARTNGNQVTRQRFDTNVAAGDDAIEFGPGISLSDVVFGWNGDNLVLSYRGDTASQITIKGQRFANSAVESVKLADGFSFSLGGLLLAVSDTTTGTAAGELIVDRFGVWHDSLSGGAGDDVLVGYGGNDTLSGGDGDDTLEGGAGADVLNGGANSLTADAVNAGDTARYAGSAAAVTVNLNLTGAQSSAGSDADGDTLTGIENLVGSAFNDTLTGDANANKLFGLGGNDTLRGGGGDDVLGGDDGDDLLYGDDGADSISGGMGNDRQWGGTGNDVISGGDGNDTAYGEAGNDTLVGDAGNDTLVGGIGDDVLVGGSGDDTLLGEDGNDTLDGGGGADSLQGGAGDDTYAFDRTSGVDVLTDTSGSNTITFDSSVAYDQLWLTRVGNDLRVGVIGSATAITVSGFYSASNMSRVHAIQTTTHVIFLDHPDSLNLVAAMTAQSSTPAVTPGGMPTAIRSLLGNYWHAGSKAAPTGPSSARALVTPEDTPITIDGNYGVIDHDQNVVRYTIDPGNSPKMGTVTWIDPATGALTYTPGADLFGEESFVVVATDADGQSVALPVRITVTPVNDPPRDVRVGGNGKLEVLEGAPDSTTAVGTQVGVITSTDVEGDAVTYKLDDDAGGRFYLGTDGTLFVKNVALLDREVAASHKIRVTATDVYGASSPSTEFTVTILNVNEKPFKPVLSGASGILSEFVSGSTLSNTGKIVAGFTTSDPDGAPAPTIRFLGDASGNPGNRFSISGTNVLLASEPDFESLATSGFTISDSDGDGLGEVTLTGRIVAHDGAIVSDPLEFSIKVEDVNQRQTAITLAGAATSILERDRVASGTSRPAVVLGTLSTADPDLVGQLTGQQVYTVFEGSSTTASTRFGVNASSQLVLLANQSLDYETDGASISLRVRATDKSSAPLSFDATFTFAITNADDVIDGSSAADTLTGQQNRDILRGYAGNDTLSGLAGNDQLQGGDGNDTLYGGDGLDTLQGEAGDDRLFGEAGDDNLDGGDGSDVLDGGAGNDTLAGGLGNDGIRAAGTEAWRGFSAAGLIGGSGNDTLNGGDGDDYLEGGDGADTLTGGLGFDGVSYVNSSTGVTVNLASGAGLNGQAAGDVLSGIELIEGSNYADTLTGSANADVLRGGGGDDIIKGGAGNDFLIGGGGNDVLDAESGDDYLDGGAGNDMLIGGLDNDTYFIGRGQGDDRIQNFDPSGADFDHLAFDGSILYNHLWFDRVDASGTLNASGAHLRITILGTSGSDGAVTIENWFTIADRTLPENYFRIDLISDGDVRAALPVNVDALVALMAGVPAGSRPTTQNAMTTYRAANASFANAMEDYWGRLSPPKISDTVSISGLEPLDGAAQTVSFAVRAWYDDDQQLGVTISASNIDLNLTATGGNVLSNYVTAVSYGTPDAAGNRTVTLTLAPNASTHLLPGQTLPLQLQATIRGTTRSAIDQGGISLSIAPTADTGSFSQLASAGGNAGTNIPISITAVTPDVDGSETVEVLVKGLPSGYSLVNASGGAVGVYESASSWWRLTAGQLAGLRLAVPTGRFENAPLSFAVQTKDGSSTRTSAWSNLNVVVNGKPTNITLSGSASENAAANTFVGTLIGVDPDTAEGASAPTSFELLNNAGGRYVLDPTNTSRLLVANGGSNLDYEAADRDSANTITVRVRDAAGLYYDKQIVVPLVNVNEANSLLYYGPGNRLVNSGLTSMSGWALAWNPNGILQGSIYVGSYQGKNFIKGNFNATAADQIVSIGTDAGSLFAVRPGDYFSVQAGLETGGTAKSVDLIVFWFDANGNGLGNSWVGRAPAGSGYNTKVSGFVTAPQGAVSASLTASMYTNGVGSGSFSMVEPMVASAVPGQTGAPVFTSQQSPLGFDIGNRLKNAALTSMSGWTLAWNPNGILQGDIYVGSYQNKNYIKGVFNATAADQIVSVGSDFTSRFAVQGGDYFSVQAGLETSGSAKSTELIIWWYDANGNSLGNSWVGRVGSAAGYNTRVSGFVTAPTGAVTATLTASMYTAGAGAGFFSMVEPMVASATPGQTTIPAFTPEEITVGVAESLAVGTLLGTVSAADFDLPTDAFGQQRYYFLNGSTISGTSSDGRYSIDPNSGQMRVAFALNYEAGNQTGTYTVVARDNAGAAGYNQSATTVTLTVADVNEQNTLPQNAGNRVANAGFVDMSSWSLNGSTGGIVQGDVFVGNYLGKGYIRGNFNATGANQFVNVGTTWDSRFAVKPGEYFSVQAGLETSGAAANADFGVWWWDANGGSLGTSWVGRVGPQAGYATKVSGFVTAPAGAVSATYGVEMHTSGPGGGFFSLAEPMIAPATPGQNTYPAFAASRNAMWVAENTSSGTYVGTVSASDPDSPTLATGQQRYFFSYNGNVSDTSWDGRYTIDQMSGQIRTKVVPNYETGSPSTSYIVIARDNAGLSGYNQVSSVVAIDVTNLNEANYLPGNVPMLVSENYGADTATHRYVGRVAPASDPDMPSTAWGQQRYLFSNGQTTSADGRFSIDTISGEIWTAAVIDYDGPNGFRGGDYTILARDNAGAAGYNQSSTQIRININDLNEPHVLSSGFFPVAETVANGPVIAVARLQSMVVDPEGRSMEWQFADGSYESGIFAINGSGEVSLKYGSVDYEALVELYRTEGYFDQDGGWNEYQVYDGRDTSRATFNLGVKAFDGQHTAYGTVTIVVTDVNERLDFSTGVTISGNGKGKIQQLSPLNYWVWANTAGTDLGVQFTGFDPERVPGATFSIGPVTWSERNAVSSTSDEINALSYPTISMSQDGKLSFFTPDQRSDGEWEGGLKNGYRRAVTLDASFAVTMTDATGLSRTETFTWTFLRRGSNTPPIVLDLDGDGLELVSYNTSHVKFDMDNDGVSDRTGWVGADDGMLVLDRNANGVIDGQAEISFADDAAGAISDLEGLRAFDTNENGLFDSGDERFGEFQIWRDANQDGVSQSEELQTLAQAGIAQVNLTFTPTGELPGGPDNIIYAKSDYLRTDGSNGTVGDAFLNFDPSDIESVAPPVVLDFDNDGASLVALAGSKTRFDMDGDGVADETGWIEGDDAFLALDRNGNGEIDGIAEISFVGDLAGAKTDLEGLAAFDSNRDGKLDGQDERFVAFKLWFDRDSNGKTDAGELVSLAEAGVASIDLSGEPTGESTRNGENVVYNRASFTRTDGRTAGLLDVGLAFNALPAVPAVTMQASDWDRSARHYRFTGAADGVHVSARSPKGVVSAQAGLIGPAALVAFEDRTIGLLSTIVIDLDGDGLEARRASKTNAAFDMDGDGTADDTGWISGGDGLLVIDRDGDGLITGASELSFLSEKAGAKSAWDALGVLDNNRDGKIDKTDARFGELKVWKDTNANGVTDEGELQSLSDLKISGINLASSAVGESAKAGDNLALTTATFTRENGVTGTIGNVALAFAPSSARNHAQEAAARLVQAMSAFGATGASDDGLLAHAREQSQALHVLASPVA